LRKILNFRYLFPKHLNSSRIVQLLLTKVTKDVNSTSNVVCLTLTKSGWLPSRHVYHHDYGNCNFTGSSIQTSFSRMSCLQLCNDLSFSRSSAPCFGAFRS